MVKNQGWIFSIQSFWKRLPESLRLVLISTLLITGAAVLATAGLSQLFTGTWELLTGERILTLSLVVLTPVILGVVFNSLIG